MAAGTATGGTHSMGSASGGHPQVELATHPRTRSTLHKALYCQGYRGYLLPTVACGSEAAPSPAERIERAARTHDLRARGRLRLAPGSVSRRHFRGAASAVTHGSCRALSSTPCSHVQHALSVWVPLGGCSRNKGVSRH